VPDAQARALTAFGAGWKPIGLDDLGRLPRASSSAVWTSSLNAALETAEEATARGPAPPRRELDDDVLELGPSLERRGLLGAS
jgi:hypothetical protein